MELASRSDLRRRWLWVPAFAGPTREKGLRTGQIEDALGDDAEHHLTRAALDRIGLGAQPGARASAVPRTLAFPFQRVDAAGRHQDFVAALVQLGAVIFHRR